MNPLGVQTGAVVVVVGAAVVVVVGGTVVVVVVVGGSTQPNSGLGRRPSGQRHSPLRHSPPAQERPHAPQLARSRFLSTQPFGQGSVPAGQLHSPLRLRICPGIGQSVWAEADRTPTAMAASPPSKPRRVFGTARERTRRSNERGSTRASLSAFDVAANRRVDVATLWHQTGQVNRRSEFGETSLPTPSLP